MSVGTDLLFRILRLFSSPSTSPSLTPLNTLLSEIAKVAAAASGHLCGLTVQRWLRFLGLDSSVDDCTAMLLEALVCYSTSLPESPVEHRDEDPGKLECPYDAFALWAVNVSGEGAADSDVGTAYDRIHAAFHGNIDRLIASFQGEIGSVGDGAVASSGVAVVFGMRVGRGGFTRALLRAGYPIRDADVNEIFSDLCRMADGAISWQEFLGRVFPQEFPWYAGLQPDSRRVQVSELYTTLLVICRAIGGSAAPGTLLQSMCGTLDVGGTGCLPLPEFISGFHETFHVSLSEPVCGVIASQFRLPGRPLSDDRINYLQLVDAVNGAATGRSLLSGEETSDVKQLLHDRSSSLFELCARLSHLHGDGPAGIAAAFAALDDNHSGFISKPELESCLIRMGFAFTPPTVLDGLFSSLDLNGDGLVSLSELQEFVARTAAQYVSRAGVELQSPKSVQRTPSGHSTGQLTAHEQCPVYGWQNIHVWKRCVAVECW
jgi:hypothetical protein